MTSQNDPASPHREIISQGATMNIINKTIAPEDVCEWDYEVKIVKSIGEFPTRHHPTKGHVFAIVRLRLKNEGNIPISTSGKSWEMVADNGRCKMHTGTYDKNIDYVETEVLKGQDVMTEIVFEIPSTTKDLKMEYIGPGGYSLEHEPSLLHPEVKPIHCPNCGNLMETGYLGMERIFTDIAWFKHKSALGLGGENLGLKDKMGMVYADAYRCDKCSLVLLRY